MREKTIKIYNIKELPDDVRKLVIERERSINVEYWEWYHAVEDNFKEKLEAKGYHDIEMSFTGFCSQGDGASFTAGLDLEKWIKANKRATKYKDLNNENTDASIYRIDHQYSHENTIRANVDNQADQDECTPTKYKRIEAQQEALENELTEDAREYSRQLYKDLQSEYEYLTDDDVVEDVLYTNEYEYMEDGRPV